MRTNHERICWIKSKNIQYLKEKNDENKKAKGTKKCVVKRQLKFQDYKNSLKTAEIDGKLNYLEKKKFNADKLKNL